jgi:ATP-dependent Lhr-like helicase
VITVGGRLVVFVERGGRKVLTFSADEGLLTQAVDPLRKLAGRRRRFEVETIDGERAAITSLGALLVASGFVDSYKGLAFRD